MNNFGYRLEIHDFHFIKVDSADGVDYDQLIQNRGTVISIGGWTAKIERESSAFPSRRTSIITITFTQPKRNLPDYQTTYPLSDGVVFLLECAPGQYTSLFQRINPLPILYQRFGITKIVYASPDGSYGLPWNTAARDFLQLSWLFSDGDTQYSNNIESPQDAILSYESKTIDVEVSDATWTILATYTNNKDTADEEEYEITDIEWEVKLFVDSKDYAAVVISSIAKYLEEHGYANFFDIFGTLIQ